ncbi:DUF5713 family protein [Streptomyces sp. NPDC049627]|uniref:DUF5713 family protein n=1 Tax=Streptomyces sp. NPDC049627 TaxID=3365595 RepID=UPI00379F6900
MNIGNRQVTAHAFFKALYEDGYYPDPVVDRGKAILLRLCERIEAVAEDFWFVANAHGFADADVEELIATRDW